MSMAIARMMRATILGLLLSVHAAQVYAEDNPSDSTGVTVSEHIKAASAAVKRSAKAVGAAAKEGAEKIGVQAKKTAHVVADETRKGAHELGSAAKAVGEKSKAALKGDKADRAAGKSSQ